MSIADLQDLTLGLGVVIFCAFQIFAFSRGWILTSFQVNTALKQAAQRADDWEKLYKEERDQKLLILQQLDMTTVVGEAVQRVLNNLPSPKIGDESSEKVS